MAARNYMVRELCTHVAEDYGPCPNDARVTGASGSRLCQVHAIGSVCVRDTDVARLLRDVTELLDELDRQLTTAGTSVRMDIRSLIGRP